MRPDIFEAVAPVCPRCLHQEGIPSAITIATREEMRGEHLWHGILHCTNQACWQEFPVIDGVRSLGQAESADADGRRLAQGKMMATRLLLTIGAAMIAAGVLLGVLSTSEVPNDPNIGAGVLVVLEVDLSEGRGADHVEAPWHRRARVFANVSPRHRRGADPVRAMPSVVALRRGLTPLLNGSATQE